MALARLIRPLRSSSISTAPRWVSLTSPRPLHFGFFSLRPLSFSTDSSKPKQQRADVQLQESDLHESFVKGSGKGGQKINKVRNCVLLTHVPTGLQVRCQKTRSLDGNRRAARKLLLQKLDDHVNGALSKRSEKIDKLRRKKASRRAKSKLKYAKTEAADEEEDGEEHEEEDGEEDMEEGDSEDDDSEHGLKTEKKTK